MNDPVLFLPGLMCDIRVYQAQLAVLSQERPVMFAPLQGLTVEEMSAAVLLAAPAKFVLVGQGLGGDVALDVLRRAPDRVARIVLMSTDPLPEAPHVAAAREARMVAARAGRMREAIAEEVPRTALFANRATEVSALMWDMAVSLGEGVFLRQSRALQRRPDQQKTLRRAVVPALILAGACDTVVPPRRQEFAAGLMPFAALQVLEDAGHMPSIEQPDLVTKAVQAFLRGPLLLR